MVKSATRIEAISSEVEKLVSWMERNKPDNKVIRVFEKDYKFLKNDDLSIRERGFKITADGIYYRGYRLLPSKS